jgi:hypothetical protein
MSKERAKHRQAEFITPPNQLKLKVGSGGLDERIIEMAQNLIDKTDFDFLPTGQRYLTALQEGIRLTGTKRGEIDGEALISTMIHPAMQLKANGAMFGYPLITVVSARLILFLEQIAAPNSEALDVVNGFANALQAIMLMGERGKDMGNRGTQLTEALDEAVRRYFERYPD